MGVSHAGASVACTPLPHETKLTSPWPLCSPRPPLPEFAWRGAFLLCSGACLTQHAPASDSLEGTSGLLPVSLLLVALGGCGLCYRGLVIRCFPFFPPSRTAITLYRFVFVAIASAVVALSRLHSGAALSGFSMPQPPHALALP